MITNKGGTEIQKLDSEGFFKLLNDGPGVRQKLTILIERKHDLRRPEIGVADRLELRVLVAETLYEAFNGSWRVSQLRQIFFRLLILLCIGDFNEEVHHLTKEKTFIYRAEIL